MPTAHRHLHCLPSPPDPEHELPTEPGPPGTLWRTDRGQIRRVLPERTLAPPLEPAVGARRFLAWLQDHELTGPRRWGGPDGLWELYLWHCHEARMHRVPDNLLGEALGALAPKGRPRFPDPVTGRPIKITVYQIPDAEPEMAEVVSIAPPKLPRLTSAARLPREPLKRAA